MRNQIIREFQQQSRETVSRSERIATRQTLRERIMAPAGPNGNLPHIFFNNLNDFVIYFFFDWAAFAVGKGAMAGGAALGLGALAFYGLGLSSDKNTILNQSM